MSTNTPKAPYGYMPAKLGGEWAGEKQKGDKCFYRGDGRWYDVDLLPRHPNNFYTRPIDVGPENELVGEDEQLPELFEYTLDGTTWLKHSCGSCSTVKDFVSHHWLTQGVLAIRRRKVVKDEYPKYWLFVDRVYRQLTEASDVEFFTQNPDVWLTSCSNEIYPPMEPITPQYAFELTGDKEILEKQSQESTTKLRSCDTAACPECGASLHVGSGSVPIEKNTEQSPPQWIPVSERLPEKGEIVVEGWYGNDDGDDSEWVATVTTFYDKLDGDYWIPLPPPPKPKTQAEKDEEWIQSNFARYCGAQGNYQSWAQGCNAAIQRERNGEK